MGQGKVTRVIFAFVIEWYYMVNIDRFFMHDKSIGCSQIKQLPCWVA